MVTKASAIKESTKWEEAYYVTSEVLRGLGSQVFPAPRSPSLFAAGHHKSPCRINRISLFCSGEESVQSFLSMETGEELTLIVLYWWRIDDTWRWEGGKVASGGALEVCLYRHQRRQSEASMDLRVQGRRNYYRWNYNTTCLLRL